MAFLWGVTNPFIKKGAKGLENVKSSSKFCQFLKELAFLITNLKVSFKNSIIRNMQMCYDFNNYSYFYSILYHLSLINVVLYYIF